MNNYTNPVTVTGNPASFEASGNGKILSLSVPFSPIQDLHGYANPWPAGGGKNKIALNLSPARTQILTNVTITEQTEQKLTFISSSATYACARLFYHLKAGTYTMSVKATSSDSYTPTVSVYYAVSPWSLIISGIKQDTPRTFTLSDDVDVDIRFFATEATAAERTVSFYDVLLEQSEFATSYEPYSNICPISGRTGLSVYVSPTQDQQDATTYAVDWTTEAGTVYGGTLDVVSGVLTVDTANIASYNGETITEPWISSMDAYVPGGTPTTGAQVVYTLATPITYQLTPTQIALILGQNNVWSDSNEAVTLTYVIELFTRYTFIVNGNDYTGRVERDSYRTAVTPVYGETVQTLDGVNHTALLRLRGSITVGLNPQTKANTAAICADLLQSPVEVQYHCLQRNANVTALMVADTISAQFLSRCLYGGASWNQLESITLKEL